MSDFDKLLKLKNDTKYLLENYEYTYHGGSIFSEEMRASLHVSLKGKTYKIVITEE